MKAAAGAYSKLSKFSFARNRASIALIAVLALLGACGKESANDSKLQHDANDPTHSTLGHQWGNVSGEDYLKFVAPLIQISDSFLPAKSPLTVRVQTWIDRFDANLRSKHADQLAGVPKPKARIISNPSVNAFIAPVPVCHDVEIRFKGRSGDPVADQIFFDIGGGSFEMWPGDEIACMPAGHDQVAQDEISAAIEEFNERAPKGCKVTLEKDGKQQYITPGKSCDTSEDMEKFGGSKQLVLLRTADWVNVYAGLITAMSEREVVGVIAHELGHYYRSHINASGSLYDLFYRAEKDVPAVRPKAVASMEGTGKRALASSSLVASMERFKRVPRQKIHSALFLAMGEMARDVCRLDKDCSKACSQLTKETDSDEFKQATLLFPLRELNADGLKVYAKIEDLATQCLSDVPLKSRSDAHGEDITWSDFIYKVGEPSWPGWVEDDFDVRRALSRWLREIVKRLPDKAPKGAKDVGSLFKTVSTYLWEEETDALKAIQQAYDDRLGFYTNEQEADELGAEWLADIGLSPKAAVETYLRIGKWSEGEGSKPSASLLETPADECQKLYENNWMDSAGKFKFVAIGNYIDPHHHTCYRAFNVDREIRAHKFKAAGDGNRGLLAAADWRDLQKVAEDATGEEAAGTKLKGGTNDLLESNLLDRNLVREIKRAASHASHFAHTGCAFSPF